MADRTIEWEQNILFQQYKILKVSHPRTNEEYSYTALQRFGRNIGGAPILETM
jgi:hypothetical protein